MSGLALRSASSSVAAPARGCARPFLPALPAPPARPAIQQRQRSSRAAPSASRPRGALLRVAAAEGGEQEPSAFDFDEPETAKDGIDLGLVLCKQGRWAKALEVFEKSLSLPGSGVKRFRDKPRLISDGEKMALLYNIACCHSQLENARSGLVALSGCLETGYSDWSQIRTDPDLAFLRTDSRFEGLMERFEKKSGFMGLDLSGLFGKQ